MLTQADIQNALKAVKYPGYSRDIVSFGLVKEISAANGAVSVSLQLTSPNPDAAQQIKAESERVLKALPGVNHVHVEVRQPAAGQAAPANPFANQNRVPGVKRVIAIASGKGGVGKSTVSANLACALQASRRESRIAGLRHLRAEHSADDGRPRTPTISAQERLVPPAGAWRESDEHRFAAHGRPAGDLARADDHQNHPAISAGGGMGRTGFSAGGFAAGHGRRATCRSARPCRWTAASS